MKRIIKTLLSTLLALLLCIGLLPAVAAAEEVDYSFTLASPDSITVDYRKAYTTFRMELSSMPPVDATAGQKLLLVFTDGTMTDGTNTVPYEVLNVIDYGEPSEWLSGGGAVMFEDLSDISYCAIRIPAGEYEPGTYTGMLEYVSRYYYPDFYDYSEKGPFYIPISMTIPEKYSVTVGQTQHGTVSADHSEAYVGDIVVLTAIPESGYYELESISAKCGGTPITLTKSTESDNQFSFVMPDGPVTVSATFRGKGICEIHIFERVWDGFDTTEEFTKGEDGLFHYDLTVEGEEFDDEYAILPYKRYDIDIFIDGNEYIEDDPVNAHTVNYYYIFDSTEDLHLIEGDGYDSSFDPRPMILVASQKGVYHFTLDPGERTLTVTHTFDDPDAEAYAYALGFEWMDEIPNPMGNAHTVAGTENSYGFGDPIEEEDIYDFEGEETAWMSTNMYGGDFTARFFIGHEGKTYGNKTVIHNVEPTGQLRQLANNGEECRIKPDFGEEYMGVYDLFYGIDSHKLMVFRRSVRLMHDFTCPHFETYGTVRPQRTTYEDGITIDREGTIYSGDEVTMSTAQYRENGRLQFAGWYNANGFEWDEDDEPCGECVSTDNVYTFAPYCDTSLLAVYTETPFNDGYYLIGPDWTADSIDRSRRFEENPDADGEYILSTTLSAGEEIKVVKVDNGAITGWYPNGVDDQYHVEAAYAGDARIYFRPAYNSDWSAFGGYIWIVREYAVTVEKATHGRVETETKLAAAGDTVTLNVQNYGSYVLDTLTVLCGGTEIETTCEDDWTYTFVMPAGDVTVTATFKGEPYTATFVPEYGNEESYILQETEYGALLTPPQDPVREGYVFGGWYDLDWDKNWWYEEDGYRNDEYTLAELLADWNGCNGDRYMRAWDFEDNTVSYDVTLYAKWTPAPAAPSFATQSLILDGKIGLSFNMNLPEIEGVDYSTSCMTFSVDHGTCTESVGYGDARTKSGRFVCYVTSIMMAEPITATFHYAENGEEKTVAKTYAITDYLYTFDAAIQEDPTAFDETTIALVHALADYGHYVQLFLADRNGIALGTDYAAMDKVYTTSYDIGAVSSAVGGKAIVRNNNTNGDVESITYSLRLDSDTSIEVYFKLASGYNGAFTVMSDDAGYTVTESGRQRIVNIANVPAHKLGETYTFEVETNRGTARVEVSALSYVNSMLAAYADTTARNTAAAIYAYAAAADAFMKAH